jgi:hypothetical protein
MILGFAIPVAIYFEQSAFSRVVTPPPIFPKLFPKPTGQNGYEEFVMAADLINSSRVWQEYERVYFDHPGPTLIMKRRVLFDPTVQRALTLIRAGLRKRIQSPRPYPELQTLVPELPAFRSLGRLLGVEMSVNFADGRNSQAIECLRDALMFGYRIQAGTLFSGVVGLYVDDVALREFGDHLNVRRVRWASLLADQPGRLRAMARTVSLYALEEPRRMCCASSPTGPGGSSLIARLEEPHSR